MKYHFGEEEIQAIQAARRENRDKNVERRLRALELLEFPPEARWRYKNNLNYGYLIHLILCDWNNFISMMKSID